jgi:hypothetical protein
MNRMADFLSRRGFLAASAAGSSLLVPGRNVSAQSASRTSPVSHVEPDGPPGPYPIPWLDMNGNHNQPAGPDLEPSHIFYFKGKVARCSGFNGAAPMVRASASCSAPRRPTTASWMVNTGQLEHRNLEHLPTFD